MLPLGYKPAKVVVEMGRQAFFDSLTADLPTGRSSILQKDDLTPQFGYVGSRYLKSKVLILGINPGNGRSNDARTPGDETLMPPHQQFAADPSPMNFKAATEAYKAECQKWHVWKRHCAEIIGAGGLSLDEIAYSNCLPWRTDSESSFSDTVAKKAAKLYAFPIIDELQPILVIALGKRAAAILKSVHRELPPLIVWNRAQAATPNVKQDRAKTADAIFKALSRTANAGR
jgi:hypothetical protein